MACRNPQTCETAALWVKGNATLSGATGEVYTRTVDVGSLASVAAFTEQFREDFKQLDIFVCNAGIGGSALTLSDDGIETTFATNHLGHFKMYLDFEDLIVRSAERSGMATVVAVASAVNFDAKEVILDLEKLNSPDNFSIYPYYAFSKLCNILFIQEVNARVGSKNVYANAAHPGLVATNLFYGVRDRVTSLFDQFCLTLINGISKLYWAPEDGARTQFYLAAAWPELRAKGLKGKYFHPIAVPTTPHHLAANITLQKGLWEFSERLLEESGFEGRKCDTNNKLC
eukprot:TRINITY_DN2559_c0_g1_i2.p1 TRINITY_DN2559_c0_g1~~TRINITY_DN2559_c0_g1_i2.p1  ORF type:complete len:286 (-),score=36.59 TRINITY_DN2559_c0_g1_i2:19-876(-)